MYDCHANAWCIRPGKVMGRKLRDFSVGHLFVLDFTQNAFIRGGVPSDTDLIMGVILCSVPFEKALHLIMDKPTKLADYASWLGFWHRLHLSKGIEYHKADFAAYIAKYNEHPDVWVEKKDNAKPRESVIPSAAKIAWSLIKAGMSESEAWNMPLSRAMMYYCIEAENNGQEFVTEKEAQAIEELNKHGG